MDLDFCELLNVTFVKVSVDTISVIKMSNRMTGGFKFLLIVVVFGSLCASVHGQCDDAAFESLENVGEEIALENNFFRYNASSTSVAHHSSCTLCYLLSTTAQRIYFCNRSQEQLSYLINGLCVFLRIYNSRICQGIVSVYKDEVLYVVGQLLLSPKQLCAVLIENCGEAYNPFKANWTVALPDVPKPPVQPRQQPKPDQPVLRVLHLADIHFDPQYAQGSEADCNDPLCCHKNSTKKSMKVKQAAGRWGTAGLCDLPIKTMILLFEHLQDEAEFDYVIWTGDLPPHNVWNQTRNGQLHAYEYLLQLFNEYLPNKLIFSALGNHESAPADSFPPHFKTLPNKYSISWLYNALAEGWSATVDPEQKEAVQDSVKRRASYVVEVKPGFRIISVNTNYCIKTNYWLYLNETDPDGTLSWLAEELQKAENEGAKVHIIGHIPPGHETCLKEWSRNYNIIAQRYENVIRAQFFGHTHSDSFTVSYDRSGSDVRPSNVMFVAPSVTTFAYCLPAYRIYTIDGVHENSTWEVLDIETYILNVTEANQTGERPKWKLSYRFKETYGLKSILPDQMDNLIRRFSTNDTVFDIYLKHYNRVDEECGKSCRKARLCELLSSNSAAYATCIHKPVVKL
ncbi:Sphingomyelin phosphodiesterase [Trichinella murrelli]|uniref:Sphingomyelin phosphodiesterase n=1 Tax=Trichinella murrelli TaxID=144512 RepID=A0A0V0U319_9BILA|nr:Sphingomyelin phosphodiesterase [Trichinella murrelli]KRX45027.1 Sphingomyelin phosphodiesterase [Trichinella murrelli]